MKIVLSVSFKDLSRKIAGNAITALTFANYVLEPFYPECDPPTDAVRIIAALLICRFRGRQVELVRKY